MTKILTKCRIDNYELENSKINIEEYVIYQLNQQLTNYIIDNKLFDLEKEEFNNNVTMPFTEFELSTTVLTKSDIEEIKLLFNEIKNTNNKPHLMKIMAIILGN